MKVVARRLLAVALSAVAAVAASWPLARDAARVYPSDPLAGDLTNAMWYAWNFARQVAQLRSPLQAPDLLWPHGQPLALQVWNQGVHALEAPLFLLLGPLVAFNLSLLLMGALNALGGLVLGRVVGGSASAGLAAGAVLAFCPFAWSELARGRPEQGLLLWLALAAAGFLALLRAPGRRVAVLTGLAWGAAGLCYWFYGYFLLLLAIPLALGWRRSSGALALAAGVAALVAAPFAIPVLLGMADPASPYRQALAPTFAGTVAGMRAQGSIGLANSLAWLAQPPRHLGTVVTASGLAAGLAAALGARRRAGFLPWLALAGLVLALGPRLQWRAGEHLTLASGQQLWLPFAGLADVLPGFARFWWPYRFLALVWVGLAGCAGALAAGRWGRPLAVGVVLLSFVELRLAQSIPDGLVWDRPVPFVLPSFFVRLGQEREPRPLLMLPFRGANSAGLQWQAWHRQPLSSGVGDNEDFLLPAERLAWIASHPGLVALEQVTRTLPEGGRASELGLPPPAELRAELHDLGFAYAVLVLGAPGASVDAYAEVFGGAPALADEAVAVWPLGTAAARPQVEAPKDSSYP